MTPTIELAKLALVTSRDEEEDEIDKGGTDSSNDTDATLVDDGTAVPRVSRSPERSSNSVLGKRPRDLERERSAMEVDSPLSSPKERDDYVMVQPQSGVQSPEPSKAEGSSSAVSAAGQDKKTGTTTAAQKKVPARKRTEVNDSTMMFGEKCPPRATSSPDSLLQESSTTWLNVWTTACSKLKQPCSGSMTWVVTPTRQVLSNGKSLSSSFLNRCR